jgi:hypothetical protein
MLSVVCIFCPVIGSMHPVGNKTEYDTISVRNLTYPLVTCYDKANNAALKWNCTAVLLQSIINEIRVLLRPYILQRISTSKDPGRNMRKSITP